MSQDPKRASHITSAAGGSESVLIKPLIATNVVIRQLVGQKQRPGFVASRVFSSLLILMIRIQLLEERKEGKSETSVVCHIITGSSPWRVTFVTPMVEAERLNDRIFTWFKCGT